MHLVYEKIKNLIPCKICLKERMDAEFLIASSYSDGVCYLNDTSKEFYSLCNEKLTINDILKFFLDMYDVSEEELQDDFVTLIRDLQWKNLLVLKEAL